MTKAVVNPGICGNISVVDVERVSKRRVKVNIKSNCEMVVKMSQALSELDKNEVLKSPLHSIVYQLASEYSLHASCPIPMAILKAIEVEVGLALPRPVLVNLTTTE